MSERVKVPAIRFKGFSVPWEGTKFGKVVSLRRGLTYSPKDVVKKNEGIRVLRSSNINEDQFQLTDEDVFVDERAINIEYIKPGDILITSANGSNRLVGKHALVDCLTGKTVHGGFMLAGTAKHPYFANALMSAPWYDKFIIGNVLGGNGAIGNLNISDLQKQAVIIPEENEQARIGEFFHNLDRLITLEQCKLSKLKNVKEALLEKMFPQEGESVPQIRFAGFSGAWEQKKFGQIFDYLWNNSMSRADLTYEKESIQNIHYGDVLIKFPEILDMEKEDVPYIMKRILNVSKNSLLKDGDIVVTDAAEDETVGKCCEMKNICDHKVVSGLHTIPCRPKVSFGTGYLGFYMNSSAYHNQLLRLIQGSKISSISKSALENTLIKYPRLIDEQLQIGKLFCDYNASIILQQQKIEKLQNFKKACLEKMFV